MKKYVLIILTIPVFITSVAVYSATSKDRQYSTKEKVLEMAFPGAHITTKRVEISPKDREEIEVLIKGKFFKRAMTFFVASYDGEVAGYATVAEEIGKKRRITFMVVLNPEGSVKNVDILVFRESQGYEVKHKRWRDQFIGKSAKDPLRLKRDIDSISGATLSARAVTKGVRKIVKVFTVIEGQLK